MYTKAYVSPSNHHSERDQGATGAKPPTEVNQAHNSFLIGALTSPRPGAPIGNWAGRRGKTCASELAARNHRYFHQTRQPPRHKADIAPKNKMIQEAFVHVYMWENEDCVCLCVKGNFDLVTSKPTRFHPHKRSQLSKRWQINQDYSTTFVQRDRVFELQH